jgi:hypothetical protein
MIQDCQYHVSGFAFPVMPTKSLPQAKAGVGIHDFADRSKVRRRWPAFADHDDIVVTVRGRCEQS